MTARKMFTILLVANLLTVALVTAAFQAGGIVASPAPRSVADEPAAFDPNLVPFVPWYMNYQGILKDSGGTPLSGTHDLTFTIYTWNQYISQFESVWTETHNNVQFTNGLFNVQLGSQGTKLRGDIFEGMGTNFDWHGALELGIKVDGGAELSPRVDLGTVPYAHRAEYVNRFPKPHYDSGWRTVSTGTTLFTHSLGGNTDNYVVDVQFKSDPSSGLGVHQSGYGMFKEWNGSWNEIKGADWYALNTSTISVYVGAHQSLWDINKVRVRIWRIE